MSTPSKRLALAVGAPRNMVSVLGVELAVHDSQPAGDKPVIVCLHAVGHGGSDFAAFEASFSDRYRVITVDWPGHGASATDAQPASAARYTALLAAVLQQLSTPRVVLLGNSLGGAVAVRYAAAHPGHVDALILCNSAGLDRNPGGLLPNLFIGHIERKMRRGAAGDPGFAAWFRDYYAKILLTPQARAQRDAIVASGYELAPVLAQAWSSFKRRDNDVRALARGLRVPTFVAWARHDKIIRWSRNRAAVAQIPQARVQLFEAGHCAFLEQPEQFNRAIHGFLAEAVRSQRTDPRQQAEPCPALRPASSTVAMADSGDG